MKNMFTGLKWQKVADATAAGTTAINSSSVDMQGYESAMFFVTFGAITSGAVTSINVATSSDNSTFNDLEGTSVTVADDDDDETFSVEVVRPLERYLRLEISRATQNAAVESIYCVQGPARKLPINNNVTDEWTGELHVTPAEGTA